MAMGYRLDRYGRQVPVGLSARQTDFSELPVIDLAPMFGSDPEAKRAMAQALRSACIEVGFFYLKNHGVPQPIIDQAFAASAEFFALPYAEKMEIEQTRTPGYPGYTPMQEESGDAKSRKRQEGFNMNLELPLDDPYVTSRRPFFEPNSWPRRPAGFRDTLLTYFGEMRNLGQKLLGGFALALDLPEGYFQPMITKPITMMRVNHYPPQEDQASDDEDIGNGAHTDFECFTILAQQKGITALQVVNGKGEWISVPPIPGTFVINIADQMERWTNDLFSSTMHRVLNKNAMDRTSIAFFFGSDDDIVMSPLPNCVPEGEAPKYPPIRAGDYVLGRVDNAYEGNLKKKLA